MSQWTHVLGVIRYDSFNLNVWPKPINQKKKVDDELDLVNHIYQMGLPEGSEGPLEVEVILTNRGPTVIITGDLRDFGKEDIQEIIDWLNSKNKLIKSNEITNSLFIRDEFINCDIEGEDPIILYFDDERKWMKAKCMLILDK